MHWILQFFGRLHPMLVHFPIGILFLAFLFECLSNFKRYASLRASVPPTLLIGAVFAIVSVVSGLFLFEEGGYENAVVELHRNLGIATAIFVIILYLFLAKAIRYFSRFAEKRFIRMISFVVMIVLLSITGHLGGTLTHGEEYLFEYLSSEEDNTDPSAKLQSIKEIDSAVLYTEVIEPILNSRCYSCHSSRKQKGELRLDGVAHLMKGGKNGSVIDSGIPDSSSLYKRLMLPLEDEHHMPPNEKPQPSSAEIALVKAWIEDGASFEKIVSTYKETGKIKSYFQLLIAQSSKEELIPSEEVAAADGNAITQLKSGGILVLPVSAVSNYLYVNFQNVKTDTEIDLQPLLKLKKQIVWLNLGGTTITDDVIKVIAQLSQLRKLSLDNTAVTDMGIETLSSSLSELTYLNLVGTKITDATLLHLAALKKLKDVYVYQTNITVPGILKFKTVAPGIRLDTGGYQLPEIVSDSTLLKSKS